MRFSFCCALKGTRALGSGLRGSGWVHRWCPSEKEVKRKGLFQVGLLLPHVGQLNGYEKHPLSQPEGLDSSSPAGFHPIFPFPL